MRKVASLVIVFAVSCTDSDSVRQVCGNGTVESGEACDDGNTDDCVGDCLGDCGGPVSLAGCGDGAVCENEACDDGGGNSNSWTPFAHCNSSCTGLAPFCGDGSVHAMETCDDGNDDDCVGSCLGDCTGVALVTGCGDGLVCGSEACDDGNIVDGDGCDSSCTRPLQAEATLTPSSSVARDWVGWSVSISGDTVVIGSIGVFNGWGSARVFERNASSWEQVKELNPLQGPGAGWFGYSIATHADTIVVGSPALAGIDSAYIFRRHEGGPNAWSEAKMISGADPDDWFGGAVAVSGDTAVIGAFGESNNMGAVYVHERDEGGPDNWGDAKRITADDGAADDDFGYSVDIDGDTLLVGARFHNNTLGAAYVFHRHAGGVGNWGLVRKLAAVDSIGSDYFGYSVSVAGDIAIVGAPQSDFDGADGCAYVFRRDEGGLGNWGQVAKLIPSRFGGFGSSVSVSGDSAVVGAPTQLMGSATFVQVFRRDQGGPDNWGQAHILLGMDVDPTDEFGHSVGIDGRTLVIGAPTSDAVGQDAGAAYVFSMPP